MVVMRRSFTTLAVVLVLVIASVAIVSAGHLSNNEANLVGTGDPDAIGHAVLNYAMGTGTYAATVTVRNLEPGATYTFVVRNIIVGAEQAVCTGTANVQGVFACNAHGITLGGFGQAAVEDDAGVEMARGVIERRGDCRLPEQVGSEREALAAPGQN